MFLKFNIVDLPSLTSIVLGRNSFSTSKADVFESIELISIQ